jgi:hypothetical protein
MPYESHCKQTKNEKPEEPEEKPSCKCSSNRQPNTIPAALLSKQPVPHHPNEQPNEWYLKNKKKE